MMSGQPTTGTSEEGGAVGAALYRPGVPPAVRDFGLGLIVPAGLIATWAIAAQSGLLAEQILPPPSLVLDTLRDMIADGSLLSSTLTSLRRVAEGFSVGALVGLAFG